MHWISSVTTLNCLLLFGLIGCLAGWFIYAAGTKLLGELPLSWNFMLALQLPLPQEELNIHLQTQRGDRE